VVKVGTRTQRLLVQYLVDTTVATYIQVEPYGSYLATESLLAIMDQLAIVPRSKSPNLKWSLHESNFILNLHLLWSAHQ